MGKAKDSALGSDERTALHMHEWGCDEVGDDDGDAALLVSELVTNTVKHGQSRAVLKARYDEGRVEVRVQDESDSLPTFQVTGPEDDSGRGLVLVSALADHCGVDPLAKSVFFAFDC